MCRHLAYLGPPVPLASLVLDAPHGLLRQSYAPRDMRGGGTVNADGFGAGWYPEPGAGPVRYRSARPIWADTAFAGLAAAIRTGALLAAVRSATVGLPVTEAAADPAEVAGEPPVPTPQLARKGAAATPAAPNPMACRMDRRLTLPAGSCALLNTTVS